MNMNTIQYRLYSIIICWWLFIYFPFQQISYRLNMHDLWMDRWMRETAHYLLK